jgi:transcriptional regulator GlxA family with amidase domain
MNARSAPIDLLFVISPQSLLLDIAGPAEAFRLANLRYTNKRQPARFRLRFAGPVANTLSSVGLPLAALEPLPKALKSPTWVVLVGQPSLDVLQVGPAIHDVAQWLRKVVNEPLALADTRNRLITICSGTLLAARAGMLDNRRCTTHHDLLALLRALAPRAHVVDNRVFVVDGPLASSAGITAGIDLALHLIAAECGDALAAGVAEDMVVYLRRSLRDPELSPFLVNRRHPHAAVHRVQDAICAEPERDWNMPAMAAVGHVTERHLLRLFVNHAGVSPLKFLQVIRLERARQLIERGASVAHASEVAGFRSDLHLRRAWSRQWGGSPRDAQRTAMARQRITGRAEAAMLR